MNDILDKNLKAIGKYNKNLVDQVTELKTLTSNVSLSQTYLKEPNLTYNNIPIHAQDGAELEAQKIFKGTEDNYNYTHVIYGLGLGYLFKEFCDNANGTVILYEPDVEMLRITLEIVDFSKELSKKNVLVASDMDSLEKIFYDRYTYASKVKCHFLNFHRDANLPDIKIVANELTRFNSILASNFNFQKKQNYNFLMSTLTAFKEKIDSTPLHLLKNKFKDIPAIIVSAGPSLNKNIEILKQYQGKAIIFCVGTAYKALVTHGIKADFLCAIEMYDCSAQFKEYDMEGINFISEGYSNDSFHKLKYKKKFLTMSQENVANVWLGSVTNTDITDYETKGTVSYNALNSAFILGCNPLILVGQDLAYTDGACYSSDSAYGNLKCIIDPETKTPRIVPNDAEAYRNEVFGKNSPHAIDVQNYYLEHRLKELNGALTFVKGQNNDMLTTEQGYALFIEYFKDFGKKYKDSRLLINSSIGGAQIDGFYNLPLIDVVSNIQDCKPDVDEAINEISYKPDYEAVLKNLTNEINLISEIINTLKHGQIDLRNFKKEIQRHKILTQTASKYLRNCLNSFLKIINDFKAKSMIISAISREEESNLTWLLKEKDNQCDYKTQLELIKALEDYFFNNEKKFCEVKEKLNKITTEIQSLFQTSI